VIVLAVIADIPLNSMIDLLVRIIVMTKDAHALGMSL